MRSVSQASAVMSRAPDAEQPRGDVGDALGGAVDVESRAAEGAGAGDERPARPGTRRRRARARRARRGLATGTSSALADDRGRGRPVDAEPGDARGDVLDHDVLGDDELLEAGGDGRPRHRRHVQQQRLARGQDPQVADHPALRRQIGGIAALAGLQGGDVVGDQALQPGHPIRPGQAEPALPRSIHDDRARARGVIPRHGAHRMLDSYDTGSPRGRDPHGLRAAPLAGGGPGRHLLHLRAGPAHRQSRR